MNGIWYYIIAFFAIWIIALIFKKRLEKHGVTVEFPILLWKTQRFTGFIDKIGKSHPKFWKYFMNLGSLIAYISMAIVTVTIIYSLFLIKGTSAVSVVLPGVEVPGSPIFIPFLSGIIALASIIIVHEFAHGIVARAENIKVKSIGLALFAILPGAFVEPDEEQMKQAKKSSRIRLAAAGSISNYLLAIISLLLVLGISAYAMPGVYEVDGMEVQSIVNNSPADGILTKGVIINSIDNVKLNSAESYLSTFQHTHPNQTVIINTSKGNYNVKLASNPDNKSRGYLGITASEHNIINPSVEKQYGDLLPWIWSWLGELFYIMFLLNLSVGLFNLLPIKPLDGGIMLHNLLSYKLKEETCEDILTFISVFIWLIIIGMLIYGMVTGLNLI